MSEDKFCANCGRPVKVTFLPEFCEEPAQEVVYHDDGGDPLSCSADQGDTREAEFKEAN